MTQLLYVYKRVVEDVDPYEKHYLLTSAPSTVSFLSVAKNLGGSKPPPYADKTKKYGSPA